MAKPKLALIGIVSKLMADDPWPIAEQLAGLGYRGIECPNWLLDGDVSGNLKRFGDLGLKAVTLSCKADYLEDDAQLDAIIDKARTLQCEHVSCWWASTDSRDAVMRTAEQLNHAGRRVADAGLKFCYHNHDHEFKATFDGVYALDMLAMHTDPATVHFELDIAWIAIGGECPVRLLRRFGSRVPIIHVKDVYSLEDRGLWTAVGTGVVPIKPALEAAAELGIAWASVEQDQLRNLGPMETATTSALYLREHELVD